MSGRDFHCSARSRCSDDEATGVGCLQFDHKGCIRLVDDLRTRQCYTKCHVRLRQKILQRVQEVETTIDDGIADVILGKRECVCPDIEGSDMTQ